MSYQVHVHEALYTLLTERFPEVDWKRISGATEAIVTAVLPIFEDEVRTQGRRQAADWLHKQIMVLPVVATDTCACAHRANWHGPDGCERCGCDGFR